MNIELQSLEFAQPVHKLARVPTGQIYGVEYTGTNVRQIVMFYFRQSFTVEYFVGSGSVKGTSHSGIVEEVHKGDWVISDEGHRFIVRQRDFEKRYRSTHDPLEGVPVPQGYERIDAQTGRKIL